MVHPVFGELDLGATPSWAGRVDLGGRGVAIELMVSDPQAATPRGLDAVARFVSELAAFDAKARAALRASEQTPDSAVSLYLDHHRAELSDATVAAIVGTAEAAVAIDPLLASLFLHRVGLDPATPSSCATFDYTISMTATNYLLVVRFDVHGDVASIAMES